MHSMLEFTERVERATKEQSGSSILSTANFMKVIHMANKGFILNYNVSLEIATFLDVELRGGAYDGPKGQEKLIQ